MTSHVVALLFAWVLVNQAGVPIPVVPSLLAAGALAAQSRTGLLVPVVVTVAATLVADLMWYGLGRWRGPQALALLGRLSRRSAARVEGAERRFLAHQLGFLFSSRFVPGVNPLAAGIAGATGIVLGRYILIATTSALAWALAWTGAGYALANVTNQSPTSVGFVTGLLAGAILAACLVLKHRRRHAMVLVLLTVLAVAGCALGPDYTRPAVIGAAGWRTRRSDDVRRAVAVVSVCGLLFGEEGAQLFGHPQAEERHLGLAGHRDASVAA